MAKLGHLDEKSDLLSILGETLLGPSHICLLLLNVVKSNLSANQSKRLSDRELLDQCSTFLMAGSDSVSVALSWCFHLLAHHPKVQSRLRSEMFRLSVSAPGSLSVDNQPATPVHSDDQRSSLPTSIDDLKYIDCFVREVLRFCPPVHATIRVAKKDDMIPVSSSVTLPNGKAITGAESKASFIHIRKGTYIHVPIEGLSYSEDIWGADALEFKYVNS